MSHRAPNNQRIAVFGAGSFGTAIANALAKEGRDVIIWARDAQVAEEINARRTNAKYLKGVALAPLVATADAPLAAVDRDILVFAIPCQHVRDFLGAVAPHLPPHARLVNLAKGIELATLKTPAQIFCDVLGKDTPDRFAVISGPTFALEICHGMPTGAAIASRCDTTAATIQHALSTPRLRLYRLSDVTGVELGGALKNVMAIGVGIAEGLGFGLNTRAGLITRCLHEMTELGLRLGANARTFSGLSGIGDLILTCTGDLSRNRQVGLRLGRGEILSDITAPLTHVVEGVPTARAVFELGQQLGLDLPNATSVYKILYQSLSPRQAVTELLSRDLKVEYED